ncbi:MAG: DUF5654 family protein [Candidatus Pacearchaeota archaeon]
MEILKTKKSFRKEFKRQVRYALTAAIGFIIAYSWRESILKYADWFSLNFVGKESFFFPLSSSIITTIFGVMLILLASKILQD